MAKKTDPIKKGTTKGTSKPYKKVTKKGGTAEVSSKAVSDARESKGAFTKPTAYKGTVVKSKSGAMAGIKTHDGTFTRASGPVARRKAAKALDYDRKVFKADSTARANRNTRFKQAVPKGE